MTNHERRRAQLLLVQAKDEQEMLKRNDLAPEARKLLTRSVERKLAVVESLRTGGKAPGQTGIERSAEVLR